MPTATLPTPAPTVTPVPTSADVAGWLVYDNSFLGYRFSYPPEARITRQGVTGFPTDELPENVTTEAYREHLETIYPDDLCVTVTYGTTFMAVRPSDEAGGCYTVPCGVTGVGDYDVTSLPESLVIDGQQATGTTFRLTGREGGWQGEFTMLDITEALSIHYGSTSGSHEAYLDAQETLLQMVLSLRLD